MNDATPQPQPFAIWNPIRGAWETSQPGLYGHLAPYSETWPTSGMTRDGSAYPLPPSAHHIPGSVSSSSRDALLRTPLASDSSRGGESLEQVKARRGTIALSHQIIDLALHGPNGHPTVEEPDGLWTLIGALFDAGDATPQRSSDGNASPDDRPPPRLS